jgi:alkylation response protein AidB-like acyl-CoA dehydrogenase
LARARGAGRDALLRQDLARIYLGTEIFRITCQRTLDKLLRMGMPGPEASVIKLHWTELTQSMPEIGMQLLGPQGLLYDTPRPADETHADPEQWLQRGYLGARAASIASGTSEIMRGIIAMQVLGLPRGT